MVDQQLTRCTEIYSQMLYILVFQSVMKYFVKKRPLKFYWCFLLDARAVIEEMRLTLAVINPPHL